MEECPKCGRDNAYCDGVEYICPDCDYTWGDVEGFFYDDDDDDSEYDPDEDYWNTVCYKEGLNRYCVTYVFVQKIVRLILEIHTTVMDTDVNPFTSKIEKNMV